MHAPLPFNGAYWLEGSAPSYFLQSLLWYVSQ